MNPYNLKQLTVFNFETSSVTYKACGNEYKSKKYYKNIWPASSALKNKLCMQAPSKASPSVVSNE
jgi:hypothetical protein